MKFISTVSIWNGLIGPCGEGLVPQNSVIRTFKTESLVRSNYVNGVITL